MRERGCNGLTYTLEYAKDKKKFDEEVSQDGKYHLTSQIERFCHTENTKYLIFRCMYQEYVLVRQDIGMSYVKSKKVASLKPAYFVLLGNTDDFKCKIAFHRRFNLSLKNAYMSFYKETFTGRHWRLKILQELS